MAGYVLDYLHRAFQAFAAWCRCDGDPDPILQRLESRRAWAAYQAGVKRQRAAARAQHDAIRDINASQKRRVESALASYVQNRKPTHV